MLIRPIVANVDYLAIQFAAKHPNIDFERINLLLLTAFYYKAPNLTGLSIEEAKETISKSPLNIREMGEVYSDLPYGTVALQEPAEGTIVKRSRNMKVWVSKESPSVFLDDLVGMNYIEASSLLNKNGMTVGEVKKMRSDLPINQIIATSPKSGEPISRGQKFDFLISNGLE